MLSPVRVTPPAVLPVSLAEAKAHLRVDHDDDDALIDAFLAAATGHLDGWTGILGRALITQTWRLFLYRWPTGGRIQIPVAPLQSVAAIRYWSGETESLIESGDYWLDQDTVYPVTGVSWPSLSEHGAAIDVVVGYGDAPEDVPAPIRQAILLLVSHWYGAREAAGGKMDEMPFGVRALLAPFRLVRV